MQIRDLGLMDYQEALRVQEETHAQVCAGAPDTLLCVEHPNVLTLGKNAKTEFLLADPVRLKALNCEVLRTDRGGEITAHMPGQLVIYPIVHLRNRRLMPRTYVCKIEQALIDVLEQFEITSKRDSINPGVWVGAEKIAALGVRIKNQVSMHGLALNVTNSFELFDLIVPCGISGRGVTSMSKELSRPVDLRDVSKRLSQRLQELLWES